MAAWVCAGCSTVYSVGAPRCPHCSSTDHYEEGTTMGKTSKAGGASIAPVPAEPVEPEAEPIVAAPVEPVEPEPEPIAPEPEPVEPEDAEPEPKPHARKAPAKKP